MVVAVLLAAAALLPGSSALQLCRAPPLRGPRRLLAPLMQEDPRADASPDAAVDGDKGERVFEWPETRVLSEEALLRAAQEANGLAPKESPKKEDGGGFMSGFQDILRSARDPASAKEPEAESSGKGFDPRIILYVSIPAIALFAQAAHASAHESRVPAA